MELVVEAPLPPNPSMDGLVVGVASEVTVTVGGGSVMTVVPPAASSMVDEEEAAAPLSVVDRRYAQEL